MKKVITYGTYDLLHYGHIKLLERAKNLGDYLIVGVTSSDFDKKRGKINVQQSLMERIQAVKKTGLADEIIVEEYEGQKIDDIINYGVDIFTVGSDWEGKFDYLKEYCDVIYLPRTEGISSTEIRSDKRKIKLGLVGNIKNLRKMICESQYVNGIEISGLCCGKISEKIDDISNMNFEELLEKSDAIYLISHPETHYEQIKKALKLKKHVLCEAPIVLNLKEYQELSELAKKNNCVLMDAIKTAYSTAYSRLLLLVKSGCIGNVISIDSTCTSVRPVEIIEKKDIYSDWNSICDWGPTALLPILQLLGTNYVNKNINTLYLNKKSNMDGFTKINFLYKNAVSSMKVGNSIKSEGELIISGTKGYVYVPAPWWKTDYFEIRYENPADNKRYFYQLEGEGLRNELVMFIKTINSHHIYNNIEENISYEIVKIMEDFYNDEVNKIEI